MLTKHIKLLEDTDKTIREMAAKDIVTVASAFTRKSLPLLLKLVDSEKKCS